MVKKNIALLPGDGIGPEVINEAVKVLDAVAERYGHEFVFKFGRIGADAIKNDGVPLPASTIALCESSDAVLLGAVGDPKFDNDPTSKIRPEQGLLQLRQLLGLHTNIRPIFSNKSLLNASPLKREIARNVDLLIFRELTEGIYFGEKGRDKTNSKAFDTCTYTRKNILKITHLAFKAAMERKRKLTLVDKANVLETSRLWREIVKEVSEKYPSVTVDYMFVDSAAMRLILNPRSFDVLLTENMFGDILSDEASVIGGSLGLLPSASIGNKGMLFEPVHGSFPEAKGKGIANPIGAILSAAMMLETAFKLDVEAVVIRKAVKDAIESGKLTPELKKKDACSTSEIGDYISKYILSEVFEYL